MQDGLSGFESGTSLVLGYFAHIESILFLQRSERQFSALPHYLGHEDAVEFRLDSV